MVVSHFLLSEMRKRIVKGSEIRMGKMERMWRGVMRNGSQSRNQRELNICYQSKQKAGLFFVLSQRILVVWRLFCARLCTAQLQPVKSLSLPSSSTSVFRPAPAPVVSLGWLIFWPMLFYSAISSSHSFYMWFTLLLLCFVFWTDHLLSISYLILSKW